MKLPAPGQSVELVLGDAAGLDANVADVRPDAVLLAVDLDLPAATAGAELRFADRRGIRSVDGLLRDRDGGRIWFAPHGRVRLVQRREHVRVAASVVVSYSPDGGRRHEGLTFDVSGGGFVLADPIGLTVGGTTHFALDLGDGDPLEVFGTAVREAQHGALAVQIDVVAPGDRERLIHWIFRRERLRRAFARGA